MKQSHRIILIFAVLLTSLMVLYYIQHPISPRLFIHSASTGTTHEFTVNLAVTQQERFQGLSGRISMPLTHGMLFVFQQKEKHGFVMRGMNYPLDFLWISGNTIVDLTPNVPVDTTLPLKSYQPNTDVDRVLEVNAGTVDRLGIRIGDTISMKL